MLELINISKSINGTKIITNISFNVEKGKTLALLGPSGCGKSTLLNIISGLTNPDTGTIKWNDIVINQTEPYKRNFGLMFQDNVLFPHLNVFDNVSFGLKQLPISSEQINKKTFHILNMMGLSYLAKRNIINLSGGEEQRVALARTIAPSPSLLMLDEPLGALDRRLRDQLLLQLRQILQELEQTAIYVTHDQEEAFKIADHIAIMSSGEIKQIDKPQRIYSSPASSFVARFLGLTNIIKISEKDLKNKVTKIDGTHHLPIPNQIPKHLSHPCILIKPQGVKFDNNGNLEGVITKLSFRGLLIDIQIIMNNGTTLDFELTTPDYLPKIGEKIRLLVPKTSIIWIEDT
tara:strand:+ start:972 stop:2012 length:1041 start_codon:yes stop_codon:yes gene_type:complete